MYRGRNRSILVAACGLTFLATHSLRAADPPPTDSAAIFREQVAPIFSRRCLSCHNETERKGGLSLLSAKGLAAGGDGGEVVVPGDVEEESTLVELVTPVDGKAAMPKEADPLSGEELAAIRRWIETGAKWPEELVLKPAVVSDRNWWSLRPLVRPAVPGVLPKVRGEHGTAVDAPELTRHSIDAFIAAKHREHGLSFAPAADRRALIRRLSFDLIGLPPTPEEIDRFVQDPDPLAYEKLVERLLASPEHGERWARHWLDVVHYGDTHGYDKDQPRPNAWPYRDYVIRALNEDKPWSRFVEEQVAGDVLYPGTIDGIEALGFISAGPWDLVGHAEVPETKIDGRIARHLDRDDMVRNTIQSFCSLTAGCAQCHNHKFDPITQEDYYSLQAVFAAVDRADKPYYADPALTAKFTDLRRRQIALAACKGALDGQLRQQAGPELVELEQRIAQLGTATGQGNARPEFGYHSAIEPRQDAAKWVQVDLGSAVKIGRIVLRPCYDDFNSIGAGFGFPVRFKLEVCDSADFAEGVTVVSSRQAETFERDFPNPGVAPQEFAAGVTGRFVRVTAVKLAPRQNDFIFSLAELEVFDETGKNLAAGRDVTAKDSIEAAPRWRKTNLVDGIAPSGDASRELAELKAKRDDLLARKGDPQTGADLANVERDLAAVADGLKKLPPPQRVYAGTVHDGTGNFIGRGAMHGEPRPIFLLNRGDVLQPGVEVQPGTLAVFDELRSRFELPPNHTEGERRAALARWLTARENSLTWRSVVNRVWQYHFGRGLVETPNDFGRMGGLPTHPELLDWLAVEFRDGGQSLKSLHRLIVTSHAYRQQSSARDEDVPAALAADADNHFLWRMNPRKLEAEAVRDAVLFVSGRLDLKMGGPAFKDFIVEHPEHSPHYEYQLHDPDDPQSHRRSVYRFIVRSQLQPFMNTLDCADPSLQVAKRNESVTPLQALALLNDGIMVVMADHFAAKLKAGGGTLEEQVGRGFAEALGRAPTETELQALTDFAGSEGLANGCRLLFNLNEFSFVD